eukprot:m.14100 g.14100  ORF g.14100 m.14100 type:complete len:368 (-) comp4254_c0_seq1:336-1439(-)
MHMWLSVATAVFAALLFCNDGVKGQTGYDIDIASSCSAFSSQTNQCIAWSSTGTIRENTCFPANALVLVPLSESSLPTSSPFDVKEVAMMNLRVGDRVLAFDESEQEDVFITVEDWLHKSVDSVHMFVTLTTNTGHSLNLTFEHVIKVNGGYAEAQTVKIGDTLHHPGGRNSTVTEVSKWSNVGLYNPLVGGSGTIYVNGVLCHILTHVGTWAWSPFKWLASTRNSTTDGDLTSDYTHPHVETLSWLAGYGESASSKNTAGVTMDVSLHDDPNFETKASFTPGRPMYAKAHNVQQLGRRREVAHGEEGEAAEEMVISNVPRKSSSNSNNQNNDSKRKLLVQLVSTSIIDHFAKTIFNELPVNMTLIN